jgi:hypothetical protein
MSVHFASTRTPPTERLTSIVDDIVSRGCTLKKQRDSLRAQVQFDAEVLWVMFERFFFEAARKLLTEAAVRAKKPTSATVSDAAAIMATRKADLTGKVTRPRLSTTERQKIFDDTAIRATSKFYTFQVNSKPIADVTPSELHQWSLSQGRDVRFVELCLSMVPTVNFLDNRPLSRYMTAEDADKFYKQAEQERRSN